jgi:hypothetical protein
MSWGNTYATKLIYIIKYEHVKINVYIKSMFFASRKESATLYMNLLSILKLDNAFKLKIATFTYKIINEDKNIPRIFTNIISTASTQHFYSARFAEKQNFIRSKARTYYGIFTFRFISSNIWEICNSLQYKKVKFSFCF